MGAFCSLSANDDDASLTRPLILDEVSTKEQEQSLVQRHQRAINELLLGWLIKKEEVTLGKCIGRGGFGEVSLGRYRNMEVAVKTIFPTPGDDLGLFDESPAALDDSHSISTVTVNLLQHLEIGMMMRLRHPRIVAFLGAGEVLEPRRGIFVVLEYVDGGDLSTRLRRSRTQQSDNALP